MNAVLFLICCVATDVLNTSTGIVVYFVVVLRMMLEYGTTAIAIFRDY